ncbi:hypothetical protein L810_8613 [Burkholderia sp. AU4i]|nr:hypothetical protein L810_8613 [Burkholderia sp. AU4i]
MKVRVPGIGHRASGIPLPGTTRVIAPHPAPAVTPPSPRFC